MNNYHQILIDEAFYMSSYNIELFNKSDFVNEFNKLNKEEPIYLYCSSGNRSQKAAQKLDRLGFKKIFDLRGGYLSWN